MKILAVITDPDEVENILRHLMKTGKSPPGLDPAAFPQKLALNPEFTLQGSNPPEEIDTIPPDYIQFA